METDLTQKKCVPCEGGVLPIKGPAIEHYMQKLSSSWAVEDELKISREFTFPDFVETMAFVNKVADLAEDEGHHPDIHVHYGKAVVDLWTHAINGLSENDFIVAAKVDEIYDA